MMTTTTPLTHGRSLRAARLGAVILGLLLAALTGPAVDAQSRVRIKAADATLACPARPSTAAGRSFNGRDLAFQNFAHQDLTNADFRNAKITGSVFVGANLTGADFSGATIVDSGRSVLVTDFSFATLDSTCFIKTTFYGPTYFTYATLTCADFSNGDLYHGLAIFGDAPLRFDANRPCRTAFRATTMSCEFVAQWKGLDLSGADVSNCLPEMKQTQDFSGALLAGVQLRGVDLDKANFSGADLSNAHLESASLQGADFSQAKLLGTQFQAANLTGASFYAAGLANDPQAGTAASAQSLASASFAGAHLKNVNLAYAHLSGVSFVGANVYGDVPTAGTGCMTTLTVPTSYAGFTKGCATAHGATLYTTDFTNAYLFGLDLSAATIDSGIFLHAVLIGATFDSAKITTGAGSGLATSFAVAHLEGADFATANFTCTGGGTCYDFTDAFVDFDLHGNTVDLLLDGTTHNRFRCGAQGCKPTTGSNVCVEIIYDGATRVPPPTTTALKCPNFSDGPCGPARSNGSNAAWNSRLPASAPGAGVPPAWYTKKATYTDPPSDPKAICNGGTTTSAW